MIYKIILSKKAEKDFKAYTKKEQKKLLELLNNISKNPFIGKMLKGKYQGILSVRVNITDRITYRILKDKIIIFILRCKTHYGE